MKKKQILLILCFLLGLCIFLYPIISSYINKQHSSKVIDNYKQQTQQISEKEKDKLIETAKIYNEDLNDPEVQSGVNYENILNIGDVMGYINIPKINVYLPIYHGTSDEVLSSAIGHVETSSFPVGGKGTHAVLAGHRGLPTARLFTDLDQLELKDKFYIHILDETLEYEIDQIITVLPEDVEKEIKIDKNQDYITLLTCTPYGINSHRLLVRGHRIQYEAHKEISDYKLSNEQSPVITSKSYRTYVIIGSICLLLLLFILKYINKRLLIKGKENKPNKPKIKSHKLVQFRIDLYWPKKILKIFLLIISLTILFIILISIFTKSKCC